MAVDKVYSPEVIEEVPLPQQQVVSSAVTQSSTGGVYSTETVKEQSFPTKKIAVELLSSVLNTRSKKILQEVQFTESGALQIGKYVLGVSGDIRITPNGIVARDSTGNTTITVDGDTGAVTISGTLQSENVITGTLAVGNGDIVIDGENRRMVFYKSNVPSILIGTP